MGFCKYKYPLTVMTAVVMLFASMCVAGPAMAGKKPSRFFNITLITPIGNAPREKAGQIIARDLEKIGIGVNLRYMEFASITPRWKMTAQKGASFEEGGYDMYLVQTAMDASVDPSGMYQRYAGDQFHPNGRNRVHYANPKFDKLIYKAVETPDNQARWALCRQAEKILYDDLPVIPLWRPAQFYGVASSVKFPEDKDPKLWTTYSFRWAKREIPGKDKSKMSLRQRTLVYGQPSDIDAFLLGYSGSSYSDRAIGYLVYDSLAHQTIASFYRGPKEERGIKPSLAESWEKSKDGKTWTIKLKKNAKWHDGQPVTADDVIFTYDLFTNKKAGYGSDKFIRINGVTWKKLDDRTVQFVCEKFSPLFGRELLQKPILPKHLLSKVPPQDLAKSDYNTGKKVIGCGPFILAEYKPGEFLRYKANENYHGGRPWFDEVVIRIIPETATAWFALKTGEIDVSEKWYGFTRELQEVKRDPKLYAVIEPSFGPQMIRVNNNHPILKNVFVKRAVSLACNRPVMVKVISAGLGMVANQPLPPDSPGHDPKLPPLKFDLDEAKRMMIKAGYDYDKISIKGPKN